MLTIPVQRADDDDKQDELGATNNTDSDECRNDRESTDCSTTKVI